MSTTKQEAREKLRGVQVRLLDLTPMETAATEWAREHIPDRVGPNTTLEAGFKPWGVFTAANGATILVCIEGVGYHATYDEDTTCDLSFYTRKVEPDTTHVSMMPVASRTVTVQELAEVETGDTVDLTEHVRIFGQRLEDNLRSMHRLATDLAYAADRLTTE